MRKGKVDSCWGWMVVAAAAFNRIVLYGVSYSAGVVYVVVLEVFNEGSGLTSWISSLIMAVMYFTCPLSGFLIRRFGERKVAIIGSLIATSGMTSSAFVNSVPLLILTYGIISGVGCGIAFMPGSVAVAKYFKNHRHLALGIASAGGGVGSFAFPPIIEFLNEQYTWRGMFLILAGVTLNICVFGLLFRPLVDPESLERTSQESGYSSERSDNNNKGKKNDGEKEETIPLKEQIEEVNKTEFCLRHFYFKKPSFYILMMNNFMYQFGASVIYGHLQAYAVYELNFSKGDATILYTISGVVVLIFKLLHGAMANMSHIKIFRPIYQYIFFYLIGGIATICLTFETRYGVYIFSVIFGMSYAACGGSLIPSLLIDIAGVEPFGITYGIVLLCLSIGQLMGAPVAGALYEHLKSYDAAFVLAGAMMIGSALIMIYPCLNDLNPKKTFEKGQSNIEVEVDEIVPSDEETLSVLDPISLSVVKGSRNSIHGIGGHLDSIHNLHQPEFFSRSSHGLHRITGHGNSLESLEIGPRSSSFSVHRHSPKLNKNSLQMNSTLHSGRKYNIPAVAHYHPTISALAIEK